MGARGFPGGKRPKQEAHPSTLFSAEVKNEWSYPSAPHGMDRHNLNSGSIGVESGFLGH